jgi:hypothetical protein
MSGAGYSVGEVIIDLASELQQEIHNMEREKM